VAGVIHIGTDDELNDELIEKHLAAYQVGM
jgi:hypothetical protein